MNNNSSKLLTYIKLSLVIIVWGSNFIVAKYLTTHADIFTVAFLRYVISAFLLVTFAYRKFGKHGFKQTRKNIIVLFLLGFVGIFLYNILFFGASSLISANDVSILFAFTPAISILLGAIFLKYKVEPFAYVGIFIALIATIGVLSAVDVRCHHYICLDSLLHLSFGHIVSLMAVICMAAYGVINKKAAQLELDPVTITMYSSLFGAILLFISFLFFGHGFAPIFKLDWKFWLGLIYIAVVCTVIAYIWYSKAIEQLGVGSTSIFLNAIPFDTILLGMIFLGTGITLRELLFGVLIVLGVIVTNIAQSK